VCCNGSDVSSDCPFAINRSACLILRVAVCCSVLQCAAVCYSVLQCTAMCCSVLQCVAVCYNGSTFSFAVMLQSGFCSEL